ncbi:MAG: DUF262 domain-containing protein [Betaproteobacteria bacterium]|nr:MAG: DUF262 domain-containing protein [Betaproteobacteria bacterium]
MNSETWAVQVLFQERRQYRVPFYQRAYVWNREEQWEPLWNDIREKADARLLGDGNTPHFLGAVVLEPQERRGLIGVESLHIIDGQQRLTTLQYILTALALLLRAANERVLLSVVESCLRNGNPETMKTPETEVYKVWPTFRDRTNFVHAMDAPDLAVLKGRFPESFTQRGTLRQIGHVHPAALEAIWYYCDQISRWIEQPDGGDKQSRSATITEAILRDFSVVCIFLGKNDDAQIIFETLNGRGAELNATDLIRNFIFMRADQEGGASGAAELYDTLWSQFEQSFWSEAQRRGRLTRPRLEWFVQTAIQAELCDEVDIGKLYVGYRRFAIGQRDIVPAAAQLQTLNIHAATYRQLISGSGSEPIAKFGKRLALWDASTTHPLALFIVKSCKSAEEQARMLDVLVSYLVRRAICKLTPKNYNKMFLQQLKRLSEGEVTAARLMASLASLDGDASRWPRDDEFRKAWLEAEIYEGALDASRTKAVLAELENGMRSARSEEPLASGLENLDVDHILPGSWFDHWPLADGTRATSSEAYSVLVASYSGQPLSDRLKAIGRREAAKKQMGNLTLLHYGVNRGAQHHEFLRKREALFRESNLHLNRALMRAEKWGEDAIDARGRELFEVAKRIWRGPEAQ